MEKKNRKNIHIKALTASKIRKKYINFEIILPFHGLLSKHPILHVNDTMVV